MTRIEPLHCTFCDSVSDWSAEHTEKTEIGEDYACTSCGSSLAIWENAEPHHIDAGALAQFKGPEPLF